MPWTGCLSSNLEDYILFLENSNLQKLDIEKKFRKLKPYFHSTLSTEDVFYLIHYIATSGNHLALSVYLDSCRKNCKHDKSKKSEILGYKSVNLQQTALHIAVLHKHEHMIKELINQGADCDSVDKNGQTPLHLACEDRYYSCVEILLGHNANTKIEDSQKKTPIAIAEMKGFDNIVKLIENHCTTGNFKAAVVHIQKDQEKRIESLEEIAKEQEVINRRIEERDKEQEVINRRLEERLSALSENLIPQSLQEPKVQLHYPFMRAHFSRSSIRSIDSAVSLETVYETSASQPEYILQEKYHLICENMKPQKMMVELFQKRVFDVHMKQEFNNKFHNNYDRSMFIVDHILCHPEHLELFCNALQDTEQHHLYRKIVGPDES